MTTQSRLPIYVLLSELITREINSGRLLVGERLPPEREMARNFNTTVRTLRKALDDLATKGMIERRQGSGNYVRSTGQQDSVYSFFRLELREGGGLPTANVLSVKKFPKPEGFPEFGTSDHAHRIRRVRFLNKVPCALEEIWLDASFVDTLSVEDLDDSMYLYYKNELKLWITRAEDKISINQVPDWVQPDFGLLEGESCSFVERLSWSQDNKTVEYSRNWINHKTAQYVARIK